MPVRVAHSTLSDAGEAVDQLAQELGNAGAVLYFVSSSYDQEAFATAFARKQPNVVAFGCSTAGEISSGCMTKRSVVGMSLPRDLVRSVHVETVDLADEHGVEKALARLSDSAGAALRSLDIERYVGLVLTDGLSCREEAVMDRIGNATDVTFVGGSAGDDLQFQRTFVHANGQARSGAAVLALLEVDKGFAILKTQSFRVRDRRLRATKVDEARRTVLEFDGRPAAEAYAAAVANPGADPSQFFRHNPLGLMASGEPYVRSPRCVQDGGIVFYCAVKEGMVLSVLESTNIVQETRRALAAKLAEVGPVAGVVNFNCILRTLELEANGETEAYAALFEGVPTIGFSTYGESYIGHINQTATMLLLRG